MWGVDTVINRMNGEWGSGSVEDRARWLQTTATNLFAYSDRLAEHRLEILDSGQLEVGAMEHLAGLALVYSGWLRGAALYYGDVAGLDTVLDSPTPPPVTSGARPFMPDGFAEAEAALDPRVVDDIATECGQNPFFGE